MQPGGGGGPRETEAELAEEVGGGEREMRAAMEIAHADEPFERQRQRDQELRIDRVCRRVVARHAVAEVGQQQLCDSV